MRHHFDGRLILKLAAQVDDLRSRVAELENLQRTNSTAIKRHAEALEVIRDVLNDDADDEEGAMLQ